MFVPGNNPGMMADAHIYGPDSIMLDLEDSVTMAEKDAARLLVYNALRSIDFGDTEIETLNGFLTDELGRIPEEHSTFDVEAKGYVFHVCGVRNGVIGKVRVKKIE